MVELVKDGNGVHPDSLSSADYTVAGIDISVTAMKAIRLKCRDCTNDQEAEIRYCPQSDCPLWSMRFGKYPKARRT